MRTAGSRRAHPRECGAVGAGATNESGAPPAGRSGGLLGSRALRRCRLAFGGEGMFERFDHTGRRVVVLAQEQARLLGHNYIGTEHLLLGVVASGGPLADALEEHGVTLASVSYYVEEIVGPVAGPATGHIPFTPRAKEVLELSLREALRLGHRPIGAPHVLLGLLREGQGVACQALAMLGADLRRLQRVAERVAGDRIEVAGAEDIPGRVGA